MTTLHSRSGSLHAQRRIGLLGGSFNPVHAGHLAMSLYALKRIELDEVWWLVSPQNPLKPTRGMAPLAMRLEQARDLARHPKIIVTDIERELGTRYTVDTLRLLRARFPAARFVWLMGADNLLQIPRWRQWAKIFALMPVAVFRRQGAVTGGVAAIRFARFRHPASFAKRLAAADPPAWLVLDNPLNLLSGTEIRGRKIGKMINWKKNPHSGQLFDDFLKEQGLYEAK